MKKLGEGSFARVALDAEGYAVKIFTDFTSAQLEQLNSETAYYLKSSRGAEIDLAMLAGDLGIGPRVISAERHQSGAPISFKMEALLQYSTITNIRELWSPTLDICWLDSAETQPALIAICRLHLAGITHDDLSTDNIMLSSTDVKLIDYGLSSKITLKPKAWSRELGQLAYAIEEASLDPDSLVGKVGATVVECSESMQHSMSHQMLLSSYARYCEKLNALL